VEVLAEFAMMELLALVDKVAVETAQLGQQVEKMVR
jgi:hypothetical protein